MLTLTDYVVLDRLYSGGTGPEAQVGDEVRLYLDTDAIPGFPEYIIGVIQNPIVRVNCETSTSYIVEYDEADLLGAVEFLRPADVINSEVTSALDELASAIEIETALRIAADATKQPLDPDLTAYANAANAEARRTLIGAGTSNLPTALALTLLPSYRHSASGAIELADVAAVGNFVSGDELAIDAVALAFGTNVTLGGSLAASVENLITQIEALTDFTAYYNATTTNLYLMAKESGIATNDIVWTANFDADATTQTGNTGGGSATYNTTTPTVIGQSAVVSHFDDTRSEWAAVSIAPAAWLPRTAGIVQRTDGDWYRQTLAADGTAEYELLPNQ